MAEYPNMKELEIDLKPKPALCVLALFLILWFTPCPEAVDPKGWKIMAVFVSTIFGFLLKPMPLGAIVLLAMTTLAAANILPLKEVCGGFGNSAVWLICMAFFISRGFSKTGLGFRLANIFISKLGKNPLGIAIAVALTTYCIAPAMPSSTARSGGTIMPLVKNISLAYGSDPEKGTARKIGGFLMLSAFESNYPVGAAYMTAMAGNTLAAAMAGQLGIEITWFSWWYAVLVPALAGVILTPIATYIFYPPELKHSPEAPEMAKKTLKELGPMTKPEKLMSLAFVGLLTMWVFGSYIGLGATTAAFIGIMFLVYTGVLTWKDIISERGAYDCLFWFSGLILMAGGLNKYGVIKWVSGGVTSAVAGLSWPVVLFILCCCCIYFAYCFASSTAFISALYASMLGIAVAAGCPPKLSAMALVACCNLQAGLTFYSGGSAPIFFNQGYVPSGDWLRTGFLIEAFHIVSWTIIGGIWWKVIGLY